MKILVLTIMAMVVLTACAVETTQQLDATPLVDGGAVVEDIETNEMHEEDIMDEEPAQQYANNIPNDMEPDVTITVEGGMFYFEPNVIEVNQGDVVQIIFDNVEGMHDLVIPGLDIGTEIIQGGQSETITFVAEQAGTFEFLCTVGRHAENGMVGELIVA